MFTKRTETVADRVWQFISQFSDEHASYKSELERYILNKLAVYDERHGHTRVRRRDVSELDELIIEWAKRMLKHKRAQLNTHPGSRPDNLRSFIETLEKTVACSTQAT